MPVGVYKRTSKMTVSEKKIHQRESNKKYRQSKKGRERRKKWQRANWKKYNKYRQTKQYKESQKRFRQSSKRKEYISKWEEEHSSDYRKAYRQTQKGKNAEKKSSAKHRKLGFIPLNNPQKDWDGHHINRNEIIYIPKSLHRSIWHSLDKPETMGKINGRAYSFLEREITERIKT